MHNAYTLDQLNSKYVYCPMKTRIQYSPENTQIERRNLESSYNFKKSNMVMETLHCNL